MTANPNPARELEAFIAAHAPLAKLALNILLDDRLDAVTRAPLVAAVRYGYDDFDLIHDKIPFYGLIDDLFVLAVGVDQVLKRAGAAGAKYADAKVAGGTLRGLLERMKRLGQFWAYCEQATAVFFAQIEGELKRNPAGLEESRDRFTLEMWNLSRETTKAAGKLQEDHVGHFLAQYRPHQQPQPAPRA